MGTSLNFGESLQITVLIGVFSLFGAIFFCSKNDFGRGGF
jgi:hypothetical protein